MPDFHWRAAQADAQIIEGHLQAPTVSQAMQQLRAQQLTPLSVVETSGAASPSLALSANGRESVAARHGKRLKSKPITQPDILAMTGELSAASPAEQLALIRAHPELAGREAVEGSLTVDSGSEQGRLGLIALSRAEFQCMADLNKRYRERFGFPCIIALALHADRESVFLTFESRLKNDQEQELANALEQIGHITRARLEKMLGN